MKLEPNSPTVPCNHIKLLFILKIEATMFWDIMFSILFPVDESPQITNSTADVNGCLSPCSFSNGLQCWQKKLWAGKHRFSVRLC